MTDRIEFSKSQKELKMVKFKVIYDEEGITITISEGRKELEKALNDKQFVIPKSFLISFENLQNYHYYIGKIRHVVPLAFGLTPELRIDCSFVDASGKQIEFNT